MFENAKVGQLVWSYTYGWGKVTDIRNFNSSSGLVCKFGRRHEVFTIDGKFDIDAVNQDLFYGPINVEVPESAKKPSMAWEFPCYGKTGDGRVVYFTSKGVGTLVLKGISILSDTISLGDHLSCWDMDKFTPCTLEAKDM